MTAMDSFDAAYIAGENALRDSRYQDAEAAFQKAVSLCERAGLESHNHRYPHSLSMIGRCRLKAGDLASAVHFQERALHFVRLLDQDEKQAHLASTAISSKCLALPAYSWAEQLRASRTWKRQ